VRTAIHHKDRTLLEQSVFYLEGCPKPAYPTSFYIRVASSKYPNSYLKWHDNAQFTFEKKDASDDAGFLFRFDFADNNWRNDPKIRTPAGEGWELIGNPVTGKNVDVAGGANIPPLARGRLGLQRCGQPAVVCGTHAERDSKNY
jgi:hypothetical protein